MLKVTIKFTGAVIFLFLQSCKTGTDRHEEDKKMFEVDSLAEARIDSAYAAINNECDTFLVHKVPQMVNLLIKKDTIAFNKIFDTTAVYMDADKKVEQVIRQLKADCDASLLKETYRRLQLLQKPMPALHKKAKA